MRAILRKCNLFTTPTVLLSSTACQTSSEYLTFPPPPSPFHIPSASLLSLLQSPSHTAQGSAELRLFLSSPFSADPQHRFTTLHSLLARLRIPRLLASLSQSPLSSPPGATLLAPSDDAFEAASAALRLAQLLLAKVVAPQLLARAAAPPAGGHAGSNSGSDREREREEAGAALFDAWLRNLLRQHVLLGFHSPAMLIVRTRACCKDTTHTWDAPVVHPSQTLPPSAAASSPACAVTLRDCILARLTSLTQPPLLPFRLSSGLKHQ